MPNKIGGLPAHPLIVHLPIVFGPILGLLAIALLNPAWRERLIKPVAALSIVTAVAAILAAESGEWLVGNLVGGPPAGLGEHAEAAELYRNLAIILSLLLIGGAVFLGRLRGGVQHAAAVLVAVVGLASIVAVVEAGHEGARLAWEGRVVDQ